MMITMDLVSSVNPILLLLVLLGLLVLLVLMMIPRGLRLGRLLAREVGIIVVQQVIVPTQPSR